MTVMQGVHGLPDFDKISFPVMEPLDCRLLFMQHDAVDVRMAFKLIKLDPSQRPSAKQVGTTKQVYHADHHTTYHYI